MDLINGAVLATMLFEDYILLRQDAACQASKKTISGALDILYFQIHKMVR